MRVVRSIAALPVVAFSLFATSWSLADSGGSICVAPIDEKSVVLDTETGNQRGYISYEFNFRIDKGPWVSLPLEKPKLLPGIDSDKKHLMTIRGGERIIESFWFTFEGRGGPELCLSYKPWYQTWLLEPPYDRPWCRCEPEPAG